MRVHHLNCASFAPLIAPPLVSHVLLVERDEGLLLVDTGLGSADVADPRRLGRLYVRVVRPALEPAETAVAQVRSHGLSPDDVTDIVLTHLDSDHAGGLSDFPGAKVHVHEAELAAARRPRLDERARYLADQWSHVTSWAPHGSSGETWFGFSGVTSVADDVLMVPLAGHTRGHVAVAVRRSDGHWLLHAGDAFFDGRQLEAPARCHRGLAVFQTVTAADGKLRRANLERLRELAAARSDEVTVFCAHDKAQYDALAAGR